MKSDVEDSVLQVPEEDGFEPATFHLCMVLSSFYLAMLASAWYNGDFTIRPSVVVNYTSSFTKWMFTTSIWGGFATFLYVLLVPLLNTSRNFFLVSFDEITAVVYDSHFSIRNELEGGQVMMTKKGESYNVMMFVDLLNSLNIGTSHFDIHCSYEYFNNHSQVCSSLTEKFQQYEFVLLTLREIVRAEWHTMISPVYLKELANYIANCEVEKNWCIILENTYWFPVVEYYMKTMKFELVQFNVNDCMYLLKVRCMNFRELDVSSTIDIIEYFFSGCFDRTITICPQIKWKFCGNPYMSVTWIIGLPKYLKDNFTGYRRRLLNECWNDFYDGSEWKTKQSKKKGLMDYMKKLTGYKSENDGNAFNRFVSRTSSLFEVDDTVFAKFHDDKDVHIRRRLFSLSTIICIVIVALIVRWWYRHH